MIINSNEKWLLVVVAKAPEPEKVKTRLLPNLTPVEATGLYRCFIQDRIREIGRLTDIDLAISYTPVDSREYFTQFISNGFQLFPQRGDDLGERLYNIFADKLNQGYSAVSIIDSDTPDLPRSIVRQSFQLLGSDGVDAVFGPCHDGGYYLVGMCRPHPELFQDIAWSTESVLQETLGRAKKLNIKTKVLARWNDLDTFEDLVKYYHKYIDELPDGDWTGCETFKFLSHMKRVTNHR